MALSSAYDGPARVSRAGLRSLDLTQDAKDGSDCLGGERRESEMNKERLGMTTSLQEEDGHPCQVK